MRTTVKLDDQLLRDTKRLAAETGRTMTAVIEDALREALARRTQQTSRERITLPTMSGRLMPGVDLDDSAALLEFMERDDDPLRR